MMANVRSQRRESWVNQPAVANGRRAVLLAAVGLIALGFSPIPAKADEPTTGFPTSPPPAATALAVVQSTPVESEGIPPRPAARASVTWSPEARPALEAYIHDDCDTAQRIVLSLNTARAPAVRRDADAIAALCLSRSPERHDLLDARTRLAELVEREPALAQRGELALAMGRIHASLLESAAALEFYEQAAERFAAEDQTVRQIAALVALAQTWAAHNEWSLLSPRFGGKVPESTADAIHTRLERIRAARARVERIDPAARDALLHIDLAMADAPHAPEDADEARLARRLAVIASAPATPMSATLALRTAQELQSRQRDEEAVALLTRQLAGTLPTETRMQIEQRLAALHAPELLVECPEIATPAAPIAIDVSARGHATVMIEVRATDIRAWLADRRTRGQEAALSAAGTLVFEREVAIPPERRHAAQRLAALAGPLEFRAAAGAYVVRVVSGAHETRKLLQVSARRGAAHVCGSELVLISGRPDQPSGALAGTFWTGGSFAGTRFSGRDGLARFTLPAEAQHMRARDWFALLECPDEPPWLLRGTLPVSGAARAATPDLAACIGPPSIRPGERIQVVGALLEPTPRQPRVRIDVTDVMNRPVVSTIAEPDAHGAFAVELATPRELDARHLRVSFQVNGRTVANVAGNFPISVDTDGSSPLRLRGDWPRRTMPGLPVVSGRVSAEYPWGAAPAQRKATATLHAIRAPAPLEGRLPALDAERFRDAERFPFHSLTLARRIELDRYGRGALSLPLADFKLPPGPLGAQIQLSIAGDDGRIVETATEFQTSAGDPPGWLLFLPTQDDPEAGHSEACNSAALSSRQPEPAAGTNRVETLRAGCGWFELAWMDRAPVVARPVIRVYRDAELLTELPTRIVPEGLRSPPWCTPGGPGLRAVATIEFADGRRVDYRCELTPSDPDAAKSHTIVATTDRYAVTLDLSGAADPRGVWLLWGEDECLGAAAVDAAHSDPTRARLAIRVAPGARERLAGATVQQIMPETWHIGPRQPLTILNPPRPRTAVSVTQLERVDEAGRMLFEVSVPGADNSGTVLARLAPARLGQPAWRPLDSPSRAALSDQPDTWSIGAWDGATLAAGSFPLQEGRALVALPLNADLAEQRLVVAVVRAGEIQSGEHLVECAALPLVYVDCPTRATSGDEFIASIRLDSRSPKLLRATLGIHLDGSLALSGPIRRNLRSDRVVAGAAPPMTDTGTTAGSQTGGAAGALVLGADGAYTLDIPGGSYESVLIPLRAQEAGSGRLHVRVGAATGQQLTATATCEVVDLPPSGASSNAAAPSREVFIRRTFGVRAVEFEHEEQRMLAQTVGPWALLPSAQAGVYQTLDPALPLPTGRPIRVREEIEIRAPLERVTWKQPLPPTVRSIASYSAALQSMLSESRTGPEQIEYGAMELPAGRHVHEYVFVALRPGAGLLPPPQINTRHGEATVRVEPVATMLRVIAP